MIALASLTPLPVATPLAGAALIACLRKWLRRAIADSLAIGFAALTLAASCGLLAESLRAPSVYWFGNWHPRGTIVLGIGFMVDPVSAGLAVVASTLSLLGLVYGWRLIGSGSNHFQPLMLIFLAAMCGFGFTVDIFNLFVFFELMSTAAFALCGLKTAEPAPLQGSFNFAITNTIAAFLVLTGIGFLYSVTGALNMAQIGHALGTRHDPTVLFAFSLLVIGFFIKAAIVPFHLWLPDAHAVAPTPVCVLFSGMMVQLGLFAVVRLRFAVFGQTFSTHLYALQTIFLALGVSTVVLGATMCYSEHHLKRMLAFSTISHAGVMLMAIGLGSSTAIAAMLIYLVAHAFIKAGLFFTSGILLHRLRAISEQALFAAGRTLRWTSAIWFLGGAGLAAAPPFLLMTGDGGLAKAAEESGRSWISWVGMLGGLLTSAAVVRVGMHTFWGWGAKPLTDEAAQVGELPETDEKDHRIRWYQFLPAAFCILLSVMFTPLSGAQSILREFAAEYTQQGLLLHLIYTGIPQHVQLQGWRAEMESSAIHGVLTFFMAVLLACTSVFRLSLPRRLRFGAFLEAGLKPLRTMQSGHPGDYVLWLTVGLATVSAAMVILLR